MWLEAGLLGEFPEDQEDTGPRQGAAAGVQEELRAVAGVEETAARGRDSGAGLRPHAGRRDNPLLAALADDADEPVVEVDAARTSPTASETRRPGAVEQFDQRLVTERARLPRRGLDQPLRLTGRECLRQRLRAAGQRNTAARIVTACAEKLLVAKEAACRSGATRDVEFERPSARNCAT